MSTYFECVSMIKTKDGALFEDEKSANDYIVNDICENLNEILKIQNFETLRYSDLVKIITLLTGNIENAKRLKVILDKHFD